MDIPDWPDLDRAGLARAIEAAIPRPTSHSPRQLERLATIGRIELADALLEGPQPTLRRIVGETSPLLPGCGGVSAILYDRRSGSFVTSATTVPGQDDGESAVRVRRSRGATRFIVDSGLGLYVEDIDHDPFTANSMLRETGNHSYVGLPIRARDETLGVMYAMARTPHGFGPEELELLAVVADRAAVVIQAATEHEQVARLARHTDLLSSVSAELAATDHIDAELPSLLGRVADVLALDSLTLVPHEPFTGYEVTTAGPDPLGFALLARPHTAAEKLVEQVGVDAAYTATIGRRPARRASLLAARRDPRLDERDRLTLDQLASVLSNVLDRADAVDEIQASNAALAHFAQVASHDLRAPLTTVAGFLELLIETEDLTEDGRRFASSSHAAAMRMSETVSSLLAHAQLEQAADRGDVDVDAVWADVVDDLRATIETTEARVVAGPLGVVRGNAAGLRVAIQNLLANALRYHRPGEPPRVTAATERVDGRWLLRIRDEGTGISDDDRERVFELFARGTRAGDSFGAGIGLATVRRIVEAHDGEVRLERNDPIGTVAVIDLPDEAGSSTPA